MNATSKWCEMCAARCLLQPILKWVLPTLFSSSATSTDDVLNYTRSNRMLSQNAPSVMQPHLKKQTRCCKFYNAIMISTLDYESALTKHGWRLHLFRLLCQFRTFQYLWAPWEIDLIPGEQEFANTCIRLNNSCPRNGPNPLHRSWKGLWHSTT